MPPPPTIPNHPTCPPPHRPSRLPPPCPSLNPPLQPPPPPPPRGPLAHFHWGGGRIQRLGDGPPVAASLPLGDSRACTGSPLLGDSNRRATHSSSVHSSASGLSCQVTSWGGGGGEGAGVGGGKCSKMFSPSVLQGVQKYGHSHESVHCSDLLHCSANQISAECCLEFAQIWGPSG